MMKPSAVQCLLIAAITTVAYGQDKDFKCPFANPCPNAGLDLVLIADQSGSVGPANFEITKQLFINVVQRLCCTLDEDIRVALMLYGSNVHVKSTLRDFAGCSQFVSTLKTLNKQEQLGGGTRTDKAFRNASEFLFQSKNGDRPLAANEVLLVTDGQSESNAIAAAQELRAAGNNIIAIAIEPVIRGVDLKQLASFVDGDKECYFKLENITDLSPFLATKLISGLGCEIDIDECASSPCANGGICNDQHNSFTCDCLSGWTGPLCDADIDECASSPCINGGTCNDLMNTFTCVCTPGWTGTLCDADIDECASSPCATGATCNSLPKLMVFMREHP